MQHFLTPRQPSILILCLLGLGATISLPLASQNIERASAETQTSTGDKITSLQELIRMPDGQHQLCSEPEPDGYVMGSGICYWFNKSGKQLIGYYGVPNSDVFVDCVSGTIQDEKVVGEAIAISWDGSPFPNITEQKEITWETLILSSASVEYEAPSRFGDISLIRFNKAELTPRDFYKYSPSKSQNMDTPPSNCNVQEWVKK
ncbi:MAG: hypothetical protein HC810_00320 [Acaryochloridaceae cyanobacterium RL_2_7]|nr:hypothetical protein [Acaryochloridaceae cyanobacterium RL_2_7]